MKDSITIVTGKKTEFVNITHKINEIIDFPEGAVLIFTRHTTTGLTVNENEKGLLSDMEKFLINSVPEGNYLHNKIDNNASSHLRSLLLECSLVLPVKNSKLDIGTWQSVFLAELDGPRTRSVVVRKF
ncbi:hypothetical protein BEH94_10030 [Candidatus Altiarchaeales archaeon WOR_SM1_SCG]|nr:hypothetical protein BEH94_10030 [Candidatus Altiarchaeales archaeon WOR_SM1_SCG]